VESECAVGGEVGRGRGRARVVGWHVGIALQMLAGHV
jgi:hypothetical protein